MPGHYHVGTNQVGSSPVSFKCCNDLESAIRTARLEVDNKTLETEDGCDRIFCGVCPWCVAANEISHQNNWKGWATVARIEIETRGLSVWRLSAPKGVQQYEVFVVAAKGDRTECPHAATS